MNRTAIGIAAIVAVLAGLFFLFMPRHQPVIAPAATSVAPEPPSKVKSFDLIIRDRKLVSGPDVLKVTEGDDVTIRITADVDEELHLHGYDKSVVLKKDVPAELRFSATLTGRFPYELEHSRTHIGSVEVYPR